MFGGGLGVEAHARVWEILLGFRPARARVLRGEAGVERNLRASRTTYFPVNPEAPRMRRSKSRGSDAMDSGEVVVALVLEMDFACLHRRIRVLSAKVAWILCKRIPEKLNK